MPLFRDDERRASDPGNRCKLYLRHALLMALVHKKDNPTQGVLAAFLASRYFASFHTDSTALSFGVAVGQVQDLQPVVLLQVLPHLPVLALACITDPCPLRGGPCLTCGAPP